jgi:elongation factor Tu
MIFRKKKPFEMVIDDTFKLRESQDLVVVGLVQQGVIRRGDKVEIGYEGQTLVTATVIGLEQFHRSVRRIPAGEHAGIMLHGSNLDQIKPGMVMAAPGSLATS